MNSEMSQHLLANLQLRARASCSPLPLLVDRAALLLANELGVDTNRQLSQNECAAVLRSQWLDNRIIECLQATPEAIGIEFDAGINTRFHRISSKLEWPTFRWADINAPDASAFSQRLVPITDNYRQLAFKGEQNDWLYRAGWQSGGDLLLVAECANKRFFECVSEACTECDFASIHIIFCSQESTPLPNFNFGKRSLSLKHSHNFTTHEPLKELAFWVLTKLGIKAPLELSPWVCYHFSAN